LQSTIAQLAPVLSLFGVMVGASLQYLYSRSAENTKHRTTLRTEAYIDYLEAVSLLGRASPSTSDKINEARALAANAKARICIYGSDAVIRQLAVFDTDGAILNNLTAQDHFLRLCSLMRSECGNSVSRGLETSLRTVLFGPD
jgi:hypothetical protein